jgi:hypothetical protein
MTFFSLYHGMTGGTMMVVSVYTGNGNADVTGLYGYWGGHKNQLHMEGWACRQVLCLKILRYLLVYSYTSTRMDLSGAGVFYA